MNQTTPRARVARLALCLRDDQSGQNLVEYGLIAGLIGVACIVVMRNLSGNIATLMNAIGSELRSF